MRYHDHQTFWHHPGNIPLNPTLTPSDHHTDNIPTVDILHFDNLPYNGQPTRIFSWAAHHPNPTNRPLAILMHGWGNIADLPFDSCAPKYFPMGYNILSLEGPGKGYNRETSRSTGIPMTRQTIYSDWRTSGDLRNAYHYHAVQAIRRAIDAVGQLGWATDRVIIEGTSLGGVMALIAAAVDPRIHTVISHFAGGRYRHSNVGHLVRDVAADHADQWRWAFDPVSYQFSRHKRLYIVAASNDSSFALVDCHAMIDQLTPSRARLATVPNVDHVITRPFFSSIGTVRQAFAHNTEPDWLNIDQLTFHSAAATLTVSGQIQDATLCTTQLSNPADPDAWLTATWQPTPLDHTQNPIHIPAEQINDRIWFVNLTATDASIISSPLARGLDRCPTDLNQL